MTDSIAQGLVFEQLRAIGITLSTAIIGTVTIACIIQPVIGPRSAPEAEMDGLNISDPGEEGYILEPKS